MTTRFLTASALALAVFVWSAGLAEAGQRTHAGGGSAPVGRAVPRGSAGAPGHPVYPGGGGHYPYYGYGYHPYYGYYGYYGYPYGYYPYGFGWSIGFGFGYPYGYASVGWGYPYGPYGAYPYPYYAPNYGGVRIENAPKDAAVYADGYYVGTVDDFDGTFQQLNLEAGPHRVEVRPAGDAPPATVDVNIRPGQTVTFRANQ